MKSIPIYLFMDAMGWEIVQNYHFLESELPFRYPVQMQFGYSSTAIPTILTTMRQRAPRRPACSA